MEISIQILDLFETLLDSKGIEIPCSDKIEQEERHKDNNHAKLYGMEYFNLQNDINEILSKITGTAKNSLDEEDKQLIYAALIGYGDRLSNISKQIPNESNITTDIINKAEKSWKLEKK